jgi:hypothetical protein
VDQLAEVDQYIDRGPTVRVSLLKSVIIVLSLADISSMGLMAWQVRLLGSVEKVSIDR